MRYQGCIFDLDGTILNTVFDIADAVNYSLCLHGRKKIAYEEFPAFLGNGSRKLIERALKDNQEDYEDIFNDYYEYYLSHYCVKTKPYDGIIESLNALKEAGLYLFVYTNKPQAIASDVISHCFGNNLFNEVIGIDKGDKVKPNSEAFLNKTKKYDLDLSKFAYFGDSLVDIETAINLHVHSIYPVAWGYNTIEQLITKKNKYTMLLTDPFMIKDIILD